MFGLSTVQMYISIALVVLLLAMGGTAYWYWNYSQNKIQTLATDLNDAKANLEVQKLTIDSMKENQDRIRDSLVELYKVAEDSRKDIDELRTKFNKNGRDLGKLAQKKTGLVQNIVNKGTANALRCMEIETGAELTEGEKNELETTGTLSVCD